MKNKNYSYYSEKYLNSFTQTRSLSKIEEMIKDDKDLRLAYVASGYVYYNKADKIKPDKQPTLYAHLLKFEKEKDSDFKKNEYRKVMDTINYYSNSKEEEIRRKKEFKEYIQSQIEDKNINLNQLSKMSGIKYSNLYNFLVKEDFNQLSKEKLRIIRDSINE